MSRRAKGLQLADTAFLGRVSGGSAFVPPQSANLQLWLRPESLSALNDGDPVDPWPDDSGNGNDFSAENSSFRPIYNVNQINGQPALTFDGVNDTLRHQTNSLGITNIYSVFIVLKVAAALGDQTIWKAGETAGVSFSKITGNRNVVHNGVALLTDGALTTNAELWSAVRTSAPLVKFYFNGANQAISNDTSALNDPTADAISKIGTNLAGVNQYAGQIAEVMVWNTNLSDGDRGIVESYLISKYGL